MRNTVVQDLKFGTSGTVRPYLVYGWQAPEEEIGWTDGPESGVLLPGRAAISGTAFVEITCGSLSVPGHPQQMLSLQLNAAEATDPVPISRGTYAWQMPTVPASDRGLLLKFFHPNAARPSDLKQSRDTRCLAIAMRRLRIFLSDEPPRPLRSSFASIAELLPAINDKYVSELLLDFESLGDNCELGLVQRRLGVEPLGLLRFSSAFLPHVLRGVDTDFASLGDRLDAAMEGVEREWMVRERGYDLRWHTFILGERADKKTIMDREVKKTRFLKEKILADIVNSEKIFVVKSRDQPAQFREILPLHLALNRRASNWLLWIVETSDPSLVGSVREVHPRLMLGHIDRFSRPGIVDDESLSGWLAVLANARAIARSESR